MEQLKHPIASYPEDQKLNYLRNVAEIAKADGKITLYHFQVEILKMIVVKET